MSKPNLDKLVSDLLLDVALLKWFATHGRRKHLADSAIALAREEAGEDDLKVLAFLEAHITPPQ
jgi:hypothetical protein